MLFTPGTIGSLTLPNRLVRSATAERMADDEGRPRPQLTEFYRELARGGVGLIITGHMYVHPSGKAHPEMTGIYSDDLIPDLAKLADAVHQEGGRVAVQINHGGMQCSTETVTETMAPSAIEASFLQQPAREMTPDEVELMVDTYAQAARRAQEAGFDAVQLHAAHGYLISEFLSPYVNRRTDQWGGNGSNATNIPPNRMNFLKAVYQAVRKQVGPDYPVFAKLGMMDGMEGGLTLGEAIQVVHALEEMGLDAVEISGGIEGTRKNMNAATGIRTEADEAYFRPLAQQTGKATNLPIILVGGFRSRQVMEDVLTAGDADFISLCRPLICEPDFPKRLQQGLAERSGCPTRESFYKLCDLEETYKLFHDNFVLKIMLAHRNAEAENPAEAYSDMMELTRTHGIETRIETSESLSRAADGLHRRAGMLASQKIVEKILTFAEQNRKKVLFVLSYPARYIATIHAEGIRWDQSFIDFLKQREVDFVDLAEAHLAEFESFQCSIRDYLNRYSIGHYNPLGNFFCAHVLKDRIIAMLEPKPIPYRRFL